MLWLNIFSQWIYWETNLPIKNVLRGCTCCEKIIVKGLVVSLEYKRHYSVSVCCIRREAKMKSICGHMRLILIKTHGLSKGSWHGTSRGRKCVSHSLSDWADACFIKKISAEPNWSEPFLFFPFSNVETAYVYFLGSEENAVHIKGRFEKMHLQKPVLTVPTQGPPLPSVCLWNPHLAPYRSASPGPKHEAVSYATRYSPGLTGGFCFRKQTNVCDSVTPSVRQGS